MAQGNILFKDRKGNVAASAIAGGAILVFLAIVVFIMPEPTAFQRGVLRFFIAVGAAMLSTFFLGGVALQGSLAGSKVGAGGGFALFILIQFVFDPLKIQTVVADAAPGIVPPRQEVKLAQEVLSRSGAYDGEVDGIPGASTRRAIKEFQIDRGLPATGYVDPETVKAFQEAEKQTSAFEGQEIRANVAQRATVDEIIANNGLKSPVAIPIIFDSVVNSGSMATKRYAKQATVSANGAPISGISERVWLLAFLEARKEHISKTIPALANRIDEVRLSKLRSQIEEMPE